MIHWVILFLINKLYDWKILKSATFNFPIICIGNLAIGGTGKTPMTEYLIEQLKTDYKIATLSRGYKRRTRGFAIANENTTAIEIGDEPMQFHQKFPDVLVTVGEERLFAIPQILHQKPETEVIILDDAFQHRRVKAGLNIVLTERSNLYTRDFIFPAGDLRDIRSSIKRANIIVVTKCSENITEAEASKIKNELALSQNQNLFFSAIEYGALYHLFYNNKIELSTNMDALLVCGIANPTSIKKHINKQLHSYEMIKFSDHHIFTTDDLKNIKNQFEKLQSKNKIIITTEKDAVRLLKYNKELSEFPIYVLPIKNKILFNQSEDFNKMIRAFIELYKNKEINN